MKDPEKHSHLLKGKFKEHIHTLVERNAEINLHRVVNVVNIHKLTVVFFFLPHKNLLHYYQFSMISKVVK